MLIDAATADRSRFDRTFDVCVVGTGPAGVTLARRLAAQGLSVALMEGGGVAAGIASQNLYSGENVGLDYYPLDATRLRLFGGSSNHWGGRCAEMDAMNFDRFDHIPLGGWPIAKADLDPFATETDSIIELPPAPGGNSDVQSVERFRRVGFRKSPPTRFGDRFGDEIAASAQIVCTLHANLLDLRLDPTNGAVSEALFRSFAPGDPGFAVRARAFALCLGALENPRMLLACTRQRPAGIGNEHDLVGRYFAEHLHYRLGGLYYTRPVSDPDPEAEGRLAYVPTRAFIERHEVLSFSAHIYPIVEERLRIAKELAFSTACVSSFTTELAQRLSSLDIDCDRLGLRHLFTQDGRPLALHANVRLRAEQSMVRDSRVTLGDDRDAFGVPRIRLDWRIGDIDYRTARTAALELGAHFAEAGVARLRIEDWLLEDPMVLPVIETGHGIGGHHHMCTTRMSRDPREGVVDANCRVHSVPNLYIGGSSVFASPGYANPTYTIVQLALRLGDHLAETLQA